MSRHFSQDNTVASVATLANRLVRGPPLGGNPLKVSSSSACCNVVAITSGAGSPVEGPFYSMGRGTGYSGSTLGNMR